MTRTAASARKHDWSLLVIGALAGGGGFYFALVGLGLTPSPSRINGPDWLALAAGLVFLAAGTSVLVRGWLAAAVAIQWLAALVIIVSLASIGTWIAFGSGDREFATNLPVQGSLGETVGRVAFGIGAIITWLMAAAVAAKGIRTILRKNNP